jgi:hypothetical protein
VVHAKVAGERTFSIGESGTGTFTCAGAALWPYVLSPALRAECGYTESFDTSNQFSIEMCVQAEDVTGQHPL